MQNSPAPDKPVVILIGNYPLDRQESMLRFRDLIAKQLVASGYHVESIHPNAYYGNIIKSGPLAKWFGYFDKYLAFQKQLIFLLDRLKGKYDRAIVHICDHSNAVYVPIAKRFFPVLVTCHDLLAVRGALGEDTDCPASGLGKKLQSAILRGLTQADYVACVSRATQSDLIRLGGEGMAPRSRVVPLALNFAYRELPRDEAMAALARAGLDLTYRGFLLHVGSSLRRKNREALLRSAALVNDASPAHIVFAGEPMTADERALAQSLGLGGRVREVRPDNETLRALYSAAHCFVFMSRFEGFGWPILEAQMSGCPVICSNRTSVPEVAGEGALIHEPDDYAAIAHDIQHLHDAAFRDSVVARGFKNAQGYTIERMMAAYEDLYRQLA